MLVLGTYRDVELRRQHPLAQTLAALAREQLIERILLRGLGKGDVARFIELTAGRPPPEALVAAIFRETEGNPFFMHEVVRLLAREGRLERSEAVTSWSVAVPEGVREVIGQRLDRLSEETNRILTIASAVGREFQLEVLERVSDLPAERLLDLVEEAIAAHLVEEGRGLSPGTASATHWSVKHSTRSPPRRAAYCCTDRSGRRSKSSTASSLSPT